MANTTIYNRANHDENDVLMMISHEICFDDRLSSIHKGVIVEILRQCDLPQVAKEAIQKASGLKPELFNKVWNELVEFGFINTTINH